MSLRLRSTGMIRLFKQGKMLLSSCLMHWGGPSRWHLSATLWKKLLSRVLMFWIREVLVSSWMLKLHISLDKTKFQTLKFGFKSKRPMTILRAWSISRPSSTWWKSMSLRGVTLSMKVKMSISWLMRLMKSSVSWSLKAISSNFSRKRQSWRLVFSIKRGKSILLCISVGNSWAVLTSRSSVHSSFQSFKLDLDLLNRNSKITKMVRRKRKTIKKRKSDILIISNL